MNWLFFVGSEIINHYIAKTSIDSRDVSTPVVNCLTMRQLRSVLSMLAVMSVVALPLYVHQPKQQTRASDGCKFDRYEPSPFERKWLANADAWGRRPCDVLNNMTHECSDWVELAFTSFAKPLDSSISSTVLSSLWYNSNGNARRVMIEPIAGVNRHPFTCVDFNRYVLNKDWLVIDWGMSSPAKAYVSDIGASAWTEELGGPSQQWLWETYKR